MQAQDLRVIDYLANELVLVGVSRGDTVLVKADVRYLNIPRELRRNLSVDYSQLLLEALLKAVGPSGTIAVLTFTKMSLMCARKNSKNVFDKDTVPYTGSLARAILAHPRSVRSTHPSNSIAAIGTNASRFIQFHTPYSFAHRFMEDFVTSDSIVLIIGCVFSNPGFSTVHLAQYHLGISQKSLLAGKYVKYFVDDKHNLILFKKWDIPGCSMGFGKMYDVYRSNGVMREGLVAGAPTYLAKASETYPLDLKILSEDETALNCEDENCIDCQFLKRYRGTSPITSIRAVSTRISKKLMRK